MKRTWTRTLCLSAFALLLLQGGLLNCVACGHSVEAVAAHVECTSDCHEHEKSEDTPCHRCEMHPTLEVVHPSRTEVHAFTFDLVPADQTLDILTLQASISFAMPNYTAPPNDPGWRELHTIIIRC